MEKKSVLVIGGTRFFGIPMIQRLLQDGHAVTIATRGMTPDTFGDAVNRIRLDIYQADSVREALAGLSFDVVIDKMGYASSDIKNVLDNVKCDHFIHMSTAGVYELNQMNISEEEYNPGAEPLVWCTRGQYEYDFTKKMAEAAILQCYPKQKYSIIRSPFVLGKQDYTGRLEFYVKHILQETPMFIDNMKEQFSVAYAPELGHFIAELVNYGDVNCVNFCSKGTISPADIIEIIEATTNKKAIIQKSADKAPYNGTQSNSLSTDKIEGLGFKIMDVHQWLRELIEYYVENAKRNLL